MDRFDAAARLAQLKAATDRITSNLLGLESDATVAMLDAAQLTGLTAERWSEARHTLASLFAAHTALKEVIETGTRLTARPLLTAARLDELETLLQGASIVVSDASLDLADRGLLSESRRVVRRSPDRLIAAMSADYDEVKSVVVQVSGVWGQLIPRLRAERARSVELAQLAGQLEVDDSELVAWSKTLRELSETVLCDPLAVDVAQLDELTAEFDRLERDLRELHTLSTEWPVHVNDALTLLERAVRARDACAEAAALANSRVSLAAPLEPLALPEDTADALEQIIARGSEDRLSGGVDLMKWRRATADRLAQLETMTRQCRSLVDERDELRARLDAYSAKAARLRLLEDVPLADAFERARRVLYSAPTDLEVARAFVREYQHLIATRGES